MIELRPFGTLGAANHGWLDAHHHFSFASYHDPARVHWGALRVWNDDAIAPKSGFPPHGHSDMEIITYVRTGAITHRDSLGNEGRTEAGDVQVMSAGTGVAHSEFNLEDEETRLFQIWIIPDAVGGAPRWDAKQFPKGERSGKLEVLASGRDEDIMAGALMIRADARLSGATLASGDSITHRIDPAYAAYLVVSAGSVTVNGVEIGERDAAAITQETEITITASENAEFLIAETRTH